MWATRSGAVRRGRPRRLLRASCATETDLQLGIEADFIAGAEDRTGDAARGARLRLRRGLGALHSRGRRRHGRLLGLGAPGGPSRRSGGATSRRSPRPRAAASSTSSLTPTSSSIWGAGTVAGRPATCAATTSPRSKGSPNRGSPSSSRPPGCASPSPSSTRPPPFLEMALEAGAPLALSSDAHASSDIGADTTSRSRCSSSWG